MSAEVNIVVAGKNVSSELVNEALRKYIELSPQYHYDNDINFIPEYYLPPLSVGGWHSFAMELFAGTEKKMVTVNVYNQPVKRQAISALVVSNEPEAVKQTGLLNLFRLPKEETIRVLFYHKNTANKKMFFSLEVYNPLPQKGVLFVLAGLGGPSLDGIFAGHAATKKFFKYSINEEGIIYKIEANRHKKIIHQAVLPGEIFCGVIELSALNDSLFEIRILAEDYDSFGLARFLQTNKENIDGRSSGMFYLPHKITVAPEDFLAKKRTLSWRLGDAPFIVEKNTGRILKGNYGLVYEYNIPLINNETTTKNISVFAEANGGVARGVFLINNALLETGLLGVKKENAVKPIYQMIAAPGASSTLNIKTMPQGGSNYPVTLIISAE